MYNLYTAAKSDEFFKTAWISNAKNKNKIQQFFFFKGAIVSAWTNKSENIELNKFSSEQEKEDASILFFTKIHQTH